MISELKKMNASVREGYQILLRAEAELQIPTQWETIGTYYLTLAEKCMAWITEVHGERLRRAFSELDDVHEKSLFYTQKYRFWMRCVWQSDTHVAILCESCLWGRKKDPDNGYYRVSHVWNTVEQTLLPPGQVWQTFCKGIKQRDLPFVPDGVYPMGEELIFYKNATQNTAFEQAMRSMSKC